MTDTPLVLVHGWGMAPAHWGTFGDELATALGAARDESFRLAKPALPGHGGAPRIPQWRVDALADEWVARWPDAVWVGWSLGGQVALAAAARAPGQVRALVLIGTTPCFVERAGWSGGMASAAFDDFRSRCEADPEATRARFLALTMRGDAAGRDGLRTLRALDAVAPAPERDALLDGLHVLATTDLVDALPAIGCPTLWLAGDRDAVVPPMAAESGARSQPRARVSCLPGAGHAPFLTGGRDVIEHTQNWLKETRA